MSFFRECSEMVAKVSAAKAFPGGVREGKRSAEPLMEVEIFRPEEFLGRRHPATQRPAAGGSPPWTGGSTRAFCPPSSR